MPHCRQIAIFASSLALCSSHAFAQSLGPEQAAQCFEQVAHLDLEWGSVDPNRRAEAGQVILHWGDSTAFDYCGPDSDFEARNCTKPRFDIYSDISFNPDDLTVDFEVTRQGWLHAHLTCVGDAPCVEVDTWARKTAGMILWPSTFDGRQSIDTIVYPHLRGNTDLQNDIQAGLRHNGIVTRQDAYEDPSLSEDTPGTVRSSSRLTRFTLPLGTERIRSTSWDDPPTPEEAAFVVATFAEAIGAQSDYRSPSTPFGGQPCLAGQAIDAYYTDMMDFFHAGLSDIPKPSLLRPRTLADSDLNFMIGYHDRVYGGLPMVLERVEEARLHLDDVPSRHAFMLAIWHSGVLLDDTTAQERDAAFVERFNVLLEEILRQRLLRIALRQRGFSPTSENLTTTANVVMEESGMNNILSLASGYLNSWRDEGYLAEYPDLRLFHDLHRLLFRHELERYRIGVAAFKAQYYPDMPIEEFADLRQGALQAAAERGIFRSDYYRSRYEDRAQANIAEELAAIENADFSFYVPN